MKTLAICCLALVLLFVASGSVSGSPALEKKFLDLREKILTLTGLEQKLEEEIRELTPQAQAAVAAAKTVLNSKKPEDLNDKEKVVVLYAAYLVQKLEKLFCRLGLVRWKLDRYLDEIEAVKKQLQTEREA